MTYNTVGRLVRRQLKQDKGPPNAIPLLILPLPSLAEGDSETASLAELALAEEAEGDSLPELAREAELALEALEAETLLALEAEDAETLLPEPPRQQGQSGHSMVSSIYVLA